MAHFKDLIQGKQSPENLKAALGEIVTYAHDVHRLTFPPDRDRLAELCHAPVKGDEESL